MALASRTELPRAVRTALADQAAFVRYQQAQLEATRGSPRRSRADRFDESGLPVPNRPGLARRVARLLGPRSD